MNKRIAKKVASRPMPKGGRALVRWNAARRRVGLPGLLPIPEGSTWDGTVHVYPVHGGTPPRRARRKMRRLSPKKRRALAKFVKEAGERIHELFAEVRATLRNSLAEFAKLYRPAEPVRVFKFDITLTRDDA